MDWFSWAPPVLSCQMQGTMLYPFLLWVSLRPSYYFQMHLSIHVPQSMICVFQLEMWVQEWGGLNVSLTSSRLYPTKLWSMWPGDAFQNHYFFKMMTFKHHLAHRPNIYHRANVRRGHGEANFGAFDRFFFWRIGLKVVNFIPFLVSLSKKLKI